MIWKNELGPDLAVVSLVGEATSHLILRKERSVLVDCHSAHLERWINRHRLPKPDLILHTQVQPEHCREGGRFPGAAIFVHEPLLELAVDRASWERRAHTTWDHPEEWGITLGREPYGIAGSITIRPPDEPLPVSETFRAGDRLEWQDLIFEVVALPGHGRESVGFFLEHRGRRLAFFSGDLICAPHHLVNLYDLEENYGGVMLSSLSSELRRLANEAPLLWLPATGNPLRDGPAAAAHLAGAIDAYCAALGWRSGQYQPPPPRNYLRVGRYWELHRGVYQIDGFGNVILFVQDNGHGLMVDPGPCEYEVSGRSERFVEDLAFFERRCGLKTMDWILITHPHGDHYDLAPLVLTRYPQCRVGALDLVARVIESPWDYPYPALLPWYNLGFDHLPIDVAFEEEVPFEWHGISLCPIHLPGHCYCHGGFLLTFNGLRIAVTGDTVQNRGESASLSFLPANHTVPDDSAGPQKAYRRLLADDVALNAGGHGSHFTNCAALYRESLQRIEHAVPFLRRVVPGGDLRTACLRPDWPRWPLSVQG